MRLEISSMTKDEELIGFVEAPGPGIILWIDREKWERLDHPFEISLEAIDR